MHIINVFPVVGILLAVANAHSLTSASPSYASQTASCSYWLENIKHQGISAFNSNTSYRLPHCQRLWRKRCEHSFLFVFIIPTLAVHRLSFTGRRQ